jgi:hypothetical protein
MERNAAGELLTSTHYSTAPTFVETQASPSMTAPPQVSSIRFKLYFATQPSTISSCGRGNTTDPSSASSQLAHLMIPFRLPFSPDLTLQGLADQAAGRIAKKYAALTDKYEIEGFDVVPLMWDGMLVGTRHEQQQSNPHNGGQKALQPKPPVVGAGITAPQQADQPQGSPKTAGSSNGWYYDTSATYRLDLAMNGPDEAEFYFALPPPSTTAPFHNNPAAMISLGSPPPFELVIMWAPRAGREVDDAPTPPPPLQPLASPSHSLPSQQVLFPVRPSSVEGSSGLSANGGRSSPAVTAVVSSKPPLPPIPRGNTPTQHSKAAAMEPRKPVEGTARFYRQPTPPSLSAQLSSSTVPLAAELNVVATKAPCGTPPSAVTAINVSNSAEESELRGLRNYYLPRHSSDSIIDITGNHTPQRSAISPPTTGSAGRQQGGNSGRRSVTTFVEEDGLLIATNTESASLIAPSPPPGPSAAHNGPSSASTTRNTSPDSESNAEDAFGFQAQLIAMTESEDRDAILMQQDMEAQAAQRSNKVAIDLIQSSSMEAARTHQRPAQYHQQHANPPIVYDMKIELPVTARGQHISSLPAEVREQGGMLAVVTSPSPPSVRSTMELVGSPTPSIAACSTPTAQAPVAAQVESPKVDAQIPTPRGATVPPAAAMSVRRSVDDHSTVSSAIVQAALFFTAAPTSQNVMDQLRHSQSEDRRDEDETDDEAVLLACDELLHDWLQLRHSVLTDERKHFRVITQQSKMHLRELQGGETLTTIRDEALAQHAQIKAMTSPGKYSSASSSSVSPSRDRVENLSASSSPIKQSHQPLPSPLRYPVGSGMSSYEVEARGVGLSTPPVPAPINAPSPQRPQQLPPNPQQRRQLDEALLRLVKIVEVTEQANRREISDAQSLHGDRLREDALIGQKRIELRAEQALINSSRNTLHDERQRRAELMEVEDRKFSMFASLCNKGIARIKASEAGSRGGSTMW